MAPPTKMTASTPNGTRTPKAKSKMVVLKITDSMRAAVDSKFPPASPPPAEVKPEPAASTTLQPTSTIGSPEKDASGSNGSTPIPNGVNDAIAMPPPSEVPVKKGRGGGKRKAETLIDGVPKPRGKPGPKKRKLEDGTDSPAIRALHKLGPKANQGAINAGLRALDRTGKPCRKWTKTGFTVKSFTGTVWEIPRWKAPPKIHVNGVSSEGKENGVAEVNSDTKSDSSGPHANGASGSGMGDVSMINGDAMSTGSVPPSSPAPTPELQTPIPV